MKNFFKGTPAHTIAGAPEGVDALVLAEAARDGRQIIYVLRDDVHLARTAEALGFFAPDVMCLSFPAWDCLPYDRVSPRPEISSARIAALAALAAPGPGQKDGAEPGRIVLTTVSALLQKVPPPGFFADRSLHMTTGDTRGPDALLAFLNGNGYLRVDTVMEPGEFALRGGIVDLYPAGAEMPFRLDFFGDDLESLRTFDPATQRTSETADGLELYPVSEVTLDEQTIARFRTGYRVAFGAGGGDDPLYESVSAGRHYPGMEHWLPLFHEDLATVLAYLPDADLVLDPQAEEAAEARLELIWEYYSARTDLAEETAEMSGVPYRALPPERLYLSPDDWRDLLGAGRTRRFSPYAAPETAVDTVDAGGKIGRDFGDVRARPDGNVYDAVSSHVGELRAAGGNVVIAAYSEGSRDRLLGLLAEHGLSVTPVNAWRDACGTGADTTNTHVSAAVVGLEKGFSADGVTVITEQDILGERMTRRRRVKVRPENLIAQASDLQEGDLVVHLDHGIGRYDGLHAIEVSGAPHDCLRLLYAGGDKLFIPVENIDVVSRYGSEETTAQLDRLGGAAWQSRKAKLKERIRDMAEKLMNVAAARTLKQSPKLGLHAGAYEEFCARFPFDETEDQARAIAETLEDLSSGRPTDRLVCGDVGFGKTEVALRAAFVAAMEGKQVAVIVPTTLLCRQHFQNFVDRFQGFPVKIAQLSRLVTGKAVKEAKAGLADGQVDIVVGTHALIAKDIRFRDLGLLIIDEEQHFGVSHKERLKQLKSDVHVLTLTATPIPRTLQLAMAGLREMSLIATPPVDRLAVRTYVLPFDPVIIREAILREQYRGGQTFYVCPRIADLDAVARQLADLVPEVKIAMAHGRMKPKELEDVFAGFAEGAYDVLLATNIIESGLDLPTVNTIVMHRADMFGLSQLYQLRGRVGRSKARAYAYLTLPPRQKITKTAERRLEVMQSLDSLGAGFTLASHDMDIRGAGNLLGEEQSGHIREVGVELYQQMLEEAVAEARGGDSAETGGGEWSPQISTGIAVMIPEHYVPDLNVRLDLYRRISRLADREETDALAAEMIDRFGKLPEALENLLAIVQLKNLCRQAGVEKIDAGPKGGIVTFREGAVANPAALVHWITRQRGMAKLRPDQKLVYVREWSDAATRMNGVRHLLNELAGVAREEAA